MAPQSNETRDQAIARIKADGPSPENIKYLRSMAQPMSVVEIAKLFGITRQGVYFHIGGKTEQLDQKDRTSIQSLRPFKVPSHQQQCTLWNNITSTMKFALDKESVTGRRRITMMNWWKTLDKDLIIVADENEPGNHLAACGGWRLEDREASDGDLIVRPHSEPDEKQKRVLSWKVIEDGLKAEEKDK
ncbi:hypothetical protein [Streptomyces narbonensis]|uniref:hypothetical protein n=1 Tax=Streptomyces narbonensis TaxID=67333 RepID=UPI0033CE3401